MKLDGISTTMSTHLYGYTSTTTNKPVGDSSARKSLDPSRVVQDEKVGSTVLLLRIDEDSLMTVGANVEK